MKAQKQISTVKKQIKQIDINKKQLITNENENYQLKIKKIQKQIASINLDINYLIEQRKFKDQTHKILIKQRKNLQNCFLFKNYQKQKQINNQDNNNQNELSNKIIQKPKIKNMFKDVNQQILQYIEQIEQLNNKQDDLQQTKNKKISQKINQTSIQKLKCQSLHLKQIFNPQETISHQKKIMNLKQKLSLLYQKIQLNLQRQEPYLHQKILQRIKRQGQCQCRKKLMQQIIRLTRQNSKWMSQQANKVNNRLQQKNIEQICVNNIGLMKRIMSKKVYNNDWIYENYGDNRLVRKGEAGFNSIRISDEYGQILKHMKQRRIVDQLSIFRDIDNKEQDNSGTIRQQLKQQIIQRLIIRQDDEQGYEQVQRQLLNRLQDIDKRIDKIISNQ